MSSVLHSKIPIKKTESHRAVHGWIRDGEEPVDEVVVTMFHAPESFTGEDVAEISCHGGLFVSQCVVELILKKGAVMAGPGEFSQRAVLNGKMDLAQAEAVADMIQAKTEASRRVAAYQLEGRLSQRIRTMREQMIKACALIELELDFSEEDVEFASRQELRVMIRKLSDEMKRLVSSFDRGKVCREGIHMVIAGGPNVGKSSILNTLLERERAIVTEIPGTTIDTIEDILDIEGILFKVTDTAGLRETEDRIEQEGVRRAEEAMERADLILLVLDGSESFQPEDEALVLRIQAMKKESLIVINKIDLEQKLKVESLRKLIPGKFEIRISALKQQGIQKLIDVLKKKALSGEFPHEGEVVLTRSRHRDNMRRALQSLENAEESLEKKMSQEFIALDLRESLNQLGEIVGETTTDDILNRIFSEFCIGK